MCFSEDHDLTGNVLSYFNIQNFFNIPVMSLFEFVLYQSFGSTKVHLSVERLYLCLLYVEQIQVKFVKGKSPL